MIVSTFNVRTLNTLNQLPELTSKAHELDIDIIYVFRNIDSITMNRN